MNEKKYKSLVLDFLKGSTIVFSYTTLDGTKYTWFINDNYVFVVSIVITVSIGCLVKFLIKLNRYRVEGKTRKRKLLNVHNRGGNLLEDCIEPNKVYEVVDDDVKRIIRDIIKDSSPSFRSSLRKFFSPKKLSKSLMTTPLVLFIAVVNQSNPGTQIALFGIDILILNLRYNFLKLGGGIITGGAILVFIKSIVVQALLGFTGTLTILFYGLILRQMTCSHLLQELPKLPVAIERTLPPSDKIRYLLKTPVEKIDEVILVQDYEYGNNSEIYALKSTKEEVCSGHLDKSELVTNCNNVETTYLEFNPQRINDKDIKRRDSSDIREAAKAVQERYEARRERQEKLKKPADNSQTSQPVLESVVKQHTKPPVKAWDSPLFTNRKVKTKRWVPLNQRTNTLSKLIEKDKQKAEENNGNSDVSKSPVQSD